MCRKSRWITWSNIVDVSNWNSFSILETLYCTVYIQYVIGLSPCVCAWAGIQSLSKKFQLNAWKTFRAHCSIDLLNERLNQRKKRTSLWKWQKTLGYVSFIFLFFCLKFCWPNWNQRFWNRWTMIQVFANLAEGKSERERVNGMKSSIKVHWISWFGIFHTHIRTILDVIPTGCVCCWKKNWNNTKKIYFVFATHFQVWL